MLHSPLVRRVAGHVNSKQGVAQSERLDQWVGFREPQVLHILFGNDAIESVGMTGSYQALLNSGRTLKNLCIKSWLTLKALHSHLDSCFVILLLDYDKEAALIRGRAEQMTFTSPSPFLGR